MLTPETDSTTHYFFTAVRFNVQTADEALNREIRTNLDHAPVRVRGAGRAGDRGAAVDDRFGARCGRSLILAIDVGPVRYKRILQKMIAGEQTQ